tara:strand:- start:287 stop:982 length:696 start_codon:yes stop_codon:yes gene_type:complete
MERTVEPELMEGKEQVLSYSKADFSEGENNFINQINYYLIKNNINLNEKELIVDLGCGPGNISEKLSIKWPKAMVVGIDGSKEMIRIAELNKKNSSNRNGFKNLNYICADIKKIKPIEIFLGKKISLLVSNSLIHHITHLDDFFNCIQRLSSNFTINFHKDLKRPYNEKLALELKEKCAEKNNHILTNDYYYSLKASYTLKELKNYIFENKINSLEVFEESDQYLVIYGKV